MQQKWLEQPRWENKEVTSSGWEIPPANSHAGASEWDLGQHFHNTAIFIPHINNRSHCWKWFPLSALRDVIFLDDFNCLLFSFLSVTEFGHQPDPRQGVLKDTWDKHAWIWDKGEPSLLESGFSNQRQHLTTYQSGLHCTRSPWASAWAGAFAPACHIRVLSSYSLGWYGSNTNAKSLMQDDKTISMTNVFL